MTPRFIRLRDVHHYLGMDKNRFNDEVRPYLIEIPIGKQGIAFDRLDLDAWADHYKKCNGRLGQRLGDRLWDAKEHPGSTSARESGISTNKSMDGEFAKALKQLHSQKLKSS